MSVTSLRTTVMMGCVLALAMGSVQAAENAAPRTSPKAEALLADVRKAAGNEWAAAVDYLCSAADVTPNQATDPVIEPTRIFDNVYAVGRTSTVAYAVTTADGIVLIDAGYANDVETVLLPGLRKLGLDPAQIKAVIVGHGHGDHFGGARYLQDTYGSSVYLSAEDWATVENPPQIPPQANQPSAVTPPPANRPPPVTPPRHDKTAVPGQPIRQGDTEFTTVLIPGHTPGALGIIFPVKDGGRSHMAGLFGGTILLSGRISNENMQIYIQSAKRFADAARQAGVDVEIQNHPIFDGMQTKLDRLKTRASGAPHPFVVGRESYQRFLNVVSGCAEVQLARR